MQKLNIGDRVITLVDIYNCFKHTVGTVTQVKESIYAISFINKNGNRDYWYVSHDFTLRGVVDEDIPNWVRPLEKEEINNMKHPHAELMMQYAQDAMETNKPWERWETHMRISPENWTSLHFHPEWHSTSKYRRKSKIIDINGFEVPEPLRETLTKGTEYFCVNLLHTNLINVRSWNDYDIDYEYLAKGLIHLTKEAAELHAKALLSFTKKEECS